MFVWYVQVYLHRKTFDALCRFCNTFSLPYLILQNVVNIKQVPLLTWGKALAQTRGRAGGGKRWLTHSLKYPTDSSIMSVIFTRVTVACSNYSYQNTTQVWMIVNSHTLPDSTHSPVIFVNNSSSSFDLDYRLRQWIKLLFLHGLFLTFYYIDRNSINLPMRTLSKFRRKILLPLRKFRLFWF